MNSLIFIIKNSSCLVIKKDYFYEIEFYNTDVKPDSLVLKDTTKIEFYRLMLFITDNVRVKSSLF